jgi:penicillin amidase
MLADREGHIGWTLMGALPKKDVKDEEPSAWKELLDPSEYPQIYDPPSGFLVTANNRLLGREWQQLFGTQGFLNGIRSYQIQKRLRELTNCDEKMMLQIQLDDEALYFQRWKQLLVRLLNKTKDHDSRKIRLLDLVKDWNGHACHDSSAYFWIRSFHERIAIRVSARLLAPCYKVWRDFSFNTLDIEEPLWILVSEQPDYLIAPGFNTWDDELIAAVDDMLNDLPLDISLEGQTWGKQNTLSIDHPLSSALPFFGSLINMPQVPVSGDFWVPKVMGPSVGASQRMVVAPGKENEAIFHAPAGQSGHPLSGNYRDGHEEWLKGTPSPILPGKPQSQLVFIPAC